MLVARNDVKKVFGQSLGLLKLLREKFLQFLSWSEKYTRMDMVYFVESGFWVTVGQVVASGTSFALALAFANLLPQEIYGQYQYVLGLAGLLGALTLTGLETSVVQAVARGFEGALKTAFWENLKWSAVFIAVAFSMSFYYYFFHGDQLLAISFLIIAIFVPFISSANLYLPFLNGKKEFRTKVVYEAFSKIFFGIFIVSAILFSGRIAVLIIAYFSAQFITAIFFYWRALKKYRPNREIDPGLIRYAGHLSVLNILDIIASNLDKVLVFNYLGAIPLAVYSFAIGVPEQTKPFLKGLTNIILPRFSERTESDIRANLANKILKLFIFNLVIVMAYIALAPFFYRAFFPAYGESVLYSQIFSLSMLAGSITPIEIFLLAKKKIKEQYVIRLSVSIFQIAAVAVLTVWMGLLGLILARVITRFFVTFINVFIYIRMPKEL